MSQTANRIVKNTGFLYAKMGITMFISLWTTRLILNALGASDYGIYSVVGGAISMLGFLNGSMASATQRFMSFYQGKGEIHKCKGIFNICVVLHAILALLLILSLIFWGVFLFNGLLYIPDGREHAAMVVYGSLMISTAFTVLSVPYDATINAHENMRYYAIIGVFESILKLAVAFITVYSLMDKLVVYGVLMACIPLITLTIISVYCHKNYCECKFNIRQSLDKVLVCEIASFAGWNFISSIALVICNYGLGLVVNFFYGVLLNTALSIAQQISAQLKTLSEGLLKAVNPVITKSAGAGNIKQMMSFAFSSTKLSFFLLSILVIPFLIEAPYILQLWLKNVPEWAVLFCRLQLIASSLTTILGELLLTTLNAVGNIKKQSIYTSFIHMSSICFTTLLFYLNMPPWSMYISIIGFNVIAFKLSTMYILKTRDVLNIALFIRTVIFPCAVCFAFSVAIGTSPIYFLHPSFGRLLLVIAISSLIFVTLSYVVVLSNNERCVLNQIIKNKVVARL